MVHIWVDVEVLNADNLCALRTYRGSKHGKGVQEVNMLQKKINGKVFPQEI